jgi:hypothetical protein
VGKQNVRCTHLTNLLSYNTILLTTGIRLKQQISRIYLYYTIETLNILNYSFFLPPVISKDHCAYSIYKFDCFVTFCEEEHHVGGYYLVIIIVLLYLRYNVTFTKVLTMYHSFVNPLHHSPLSPNFISRIDSTGLIFPFSYRSIVFPLLSAPFTLSFYPGEYYLNEIEGVRKDKYYIIFIEKNFWMLKLTRE